jgi:hypothetical protein
VFKKSRDVTVIITVDTAGTMVTAITVVTEATDANVAPQKKLWSELKTEMPSVNATVITEADTAVTVVMAVIATADMAVMAMEDMAVTAMEDMAVTATGDTAATEVTAALDGARGTKKALLLLPSSSKALRLLPFRWKERPSVADDPPMKSPSLLRLELTMEMKSLNVIVIATTEVSEEALVDTVEVTAVTADTVMAVKLQA